MDLAGAIIQGSGKALDVLEGAITEAHPDRRQRNQEAPRIGMTARRRKLPTEFEVLIGTGKIWVVGGFFIVDRSQTQGWQPGAMYLKAGGMSFHIVALKPLPKQGYLALTTNENLVLWSFKALVTPTPEQLKLLPVKENVTRF
ncbi:MAG TPA: hypothetical protein VFS50_17115 [Meiothermus sp.]|nr:hypothetical protein [Meiothermus sp.]